MFHTIQEVSQILRVSEKAVRSLIKSGQLPALYIGKEIRIKAGDLANLTSAPPAPRKAKPLTQAQIAARKKFVDMVRSKSAAKKKAVAPPAPTKNSAPVSPKA